MSRLWFVVLLALCAGAAFAVPSDVGLALVAVKAMRGHTAVSIAGNSALTHVSKCDTDRRSIPEMLSAELGQPVLDVSYPGQVLTETSNLAAMSLAAPGTTTVVLPVSIFAMLEWDVVPIRSYAAFRLLNPWLYAGTLRERFMADDWFSRDLAPTKQPYTFRGVTYPDYNEIKRVFLRAEDDVMGCPEDDGRNMAFIASNYWHEYVELPYQTQYLAVFASLDAYARKHGKTLELVLMPIDLELMERLLPDDAAPLRARIADLVAKLRSQGLHVVDMTHASPNAEFVDRWCACGHLGQAGRLRVARGIARGLMEDAQASRAQP